ncbi:7875_t:CDS:2 [Funneliformis geosporum]|uniref:7875_t:CDS:1 n=1 Tax=Funneliformis geosporum TaxID=1117311 RepID=A0A9W4SFT2_9GLOM|nr:7875_t:CDS:2 [Funneliformis geosporum]
MFAVSALANPLATSPFSQHLTKRAPLCGDLCTFICGACTCSADGCDDKPNCTKSVQCTGGECSNVCTGKCGDCTFNCSGCTGTPPLSLKNVLNIDVIEFLRINMYLSAQKCIIYCCN